MQPQFRVVVWGEFPHATDDPMAHAELFVYVNGRILPRGEALVSAFDRGLLYGDGIFETMRAYQGVIFRLDYHVRRLRESAGELRIPLPVPDGELADAAQELVRRNGLQEAYVRITLTRGLHAGSLALDTQQPPTLLIDCRPITPPSPENNRQGISLGASRYLRHRSSRMARHKTLSYLDNLLILDEARAGGSRDAIILADNGLVCECATANIFLILDDEVRTPTAKLPLLNGITRQVVLELCRKLELKVLEDKFDLDDVIDADEVFITNSIIEVLPVGEVTARTIGCCPGPVTERIRQAYADEVRRFVAEFRTR